MQSLCVFTILNALSSSQFADLMTMLHLIAPPSYSNTGDQYTESRQMVRCFGSLLLSPSSSLDKLVFSVAERILGMSDYHVSVL